MSLATLNEDLVDAIHDQVLNPGELTGRARGKSLAGAPARVENRLAHGMIEDAFDLAATYAVAIATGHCFNDANRRTAFRAMNAALALNGVEIAWDTSEVGPLIVEVAQGRVDEAALAAWPGAKADAAEG